MSKKFFLCLYAFCVVSLSAVSWPKSISSAVDDACENYSGLPQSVVYAIIAAESCEVATDDLSLENITKVNKNAVSHMNCVGLMQVSKFALVDFNKRFKTHYTMKDLTKEKVNIMIGVWHYMRHIGKTNVADELYGIYNYGYRGFIKNYDEYYESSARKRFLKCLQLLN